MNLPKSHTQEGQASIVFIGIFVNFQFCGNAQFFGNCRFRVCSVSENLLKGKWP